MANRTRNHTRSRRATPPARGDQAAAYARVAGVSGVVFALLFTLALVLVDKAPGLAAPDNVYARFYATGDRGALVLVGLYIIPFAGIAFLWHLIAVRELEHELLDTPGAPVRRSEMPRGLQLAGGVAFVVLVFSGMALAGAVALLARFSVAPLPAVDVARALSAAGYGMVFVYGARVAGVYMITTTTLLRSAGVLPRWVAWLGYLAAAAVLLSWTFHPAFALILPGWLLVLSATVLLAAPRTRPGAPPAAGSAGDSVSLA